MKYPYYRKEFGDNTLTCPKCGMDLTIDSTMIEDNSNKQSNTKPQNKDASLGLGLSIVGMIINIMGLLSVAGLLISIKGYKNSMGLNGVGKGKSVAGIICACIQLAYMVYQMLTYIFA